MPRSKPPSPPEDDPTPVDVEEILVPDEPAPDDETAEAGPQHRTFVIRRGRQTRIDKHLHQRLKGISRTKIQQLIENGGVTVNSKVPKASTILRTGDVIDVILPPPAIRAIVPEPIPLHILYEDDACIVINKQANLIVHPARSHFSGTLLNGLAYHFKEQLEKSGHQWEEWKTRGFSEQKQGKSAGPSPARPPKPRTFTQPLPHKGEETDADRPDGLIPGLSSVGASGFRPGIVHRLDKNTTGVMVVAKNDQAHWQIARQFEDRTTLKAYLAIVHGNFDHGGGVIDEPLGKHPTIREAYAIRRDSFGKNAVTLYRVREQYQGFSLVELELKTGRTHQIRVHLSYLGHPIVGDIVYGGEPLGRADLDHPPVPAGGRKFVTFARERNDGLTIEAAALKRSDLIITTPALHAAMLQFVHPFTHKPIRFTAPVHEPMRGLIHDLRQRKIVAPIAKEGYWIDLTQAVPE